MPEYFKHANLCPLRSRHQNDFMCRGDLLEDVPVKDGGGRSRRQGAPSVLHAGVMPMKGEKGGGSDSRPGPWGTPKQVFPNEGSSLGQERMARVCSELCHWPGAAGVPSRVGLFATPRTVARQEPVSMGFSRQECWSGLAFSSPGSGWRKGGKHTLRLNVVQQGTNIRIFKLRTFKDTDAFMCPILCVSSHVWCRLPPLQVVVLLCTSPDSTIWRTVVQYLYRIGSGSLLDSILSHQRQV